jgi:hypothetical protein
MFDVTASGPDDAWIVGFSFRSGHYYASTMHWDGASWTTVSNPLGSERWTALYGVDAAGSDDVWAVGTSRDGPVAIHWDGVVWTAQPVSGPFGTNPGLFGVVTISPSNAWAVGQDDNGAATLLEHWNGTGWIRRSPDASSGLRTAYDVSAASPTDVWVATSSPLRDVLLHLDDASWSSEKLQAPSVGHLFIRDVTTLEGGQTFAVGSTDAGSTYAVDRCVA